jgi:hypothetical protein
VIDDAIHGDRQPRQLKKMTMGVHAV